MPKRPNKLAQLKSRAPKSDLARIKKTTDKQIAADANADPDVAPILEEWPNEAYVVTPDL